MALQHFTPKERALLEEWQKEKKKPSLSPTLSVKLFELFLHGLTCDEISALNKGVYLVEQILEARLRDGWDERRQEYVNSLFDNIVGRVTQAQAESVSFLTDMLAVAHRQHGDKLRLFLQDGDETHLGDFKINGFQTYKNVVDTLMKLTGQDKDKDKSANKKPIQPEVSEKEDEPAISLKILPAGGIRVVESTTAAQILGALKTDNEQ
jgi:hypothetical protein